MIFRRFALAIALLVAGMASQLPEFAQQYRQRLGGAIDELSAAISQFDAQAAAMSLSREQGIAHLATNPDELARDRATSMSDMVARRDRLEKQRQSFGSAGPLSQYAVLVENFDPGLARKAYSDFQPALPVTRDGVVSGFVGLLLGWLMVHLLSLPIRNRRLIAAQPNIAQWR